MRPAARRESATAWLASGAQVTVKTYAKRYGVDRYTAREDLEAIGFVFAPGDTRWSVRPERVPRVAGADLDTGQDPQACWAGGSCSLWGVRPAAHRTVVTRTRWKTPSDLVSRATRHEHVASLILSTAGTVILWLAATTS